MTKLVNLTRFGCFTLVQKVKRRVYKVHVFYVKQYFAETLQVISFKNDVYFLHGRS